jgi:arsenite oxidase small subunit
MDRRNFIKVCSVSAAAIAAGVQSRLVYSDVKDFAKVKLVDASGQPLKASSLSKEEAYIFMYPYISTPCFLINLPGAGEGGVGPNKSVVSYLAVCTHQLAYPEKAASEISYIPGKGDVAGQAASITCCVHNSAFDPAADGKVITGAAAKPLAAVRLEHDAGADEIYATGMSGADMLEDFFKAFKRKFNREYGWGKYKTEVKDTASTVLLSKYSGDVDSC